MLCCKTAVSPLRRRHKRVWSIQGLRGAGFLPDQSLDGRAHGYRVSAVCRSPARGARAQFLHCL